MTELLEQDDVNTSTSVSVSKGDAGIGLPLDELRSNPLIRLLIDAGMPTSSVKEWKVGAGTVVQAKGEVPTHLCIVHAGRVRTPGSVDRGISLSDGAPLFLAELLHHLPAAAELRSDEPMVLWTVPTDDVRKIAAGTLAVRKLAASMRMVERGPAPRVIRLADGVAQASFTEPNVVNLSRSVDSPNVRMSRLMRPPGEPEVLEFQDVHRGMRRELHFIDGVLVEAILEGPWSEIENALWIMRHAERVPAKAKKAFLRHGNLFETPQLGTLLAPDDLVCHCAAVSRREIEQACAGKKDCSLAKIAGRTGATLSCGSCVGMVMDLVGPATDVANLQSVIRHTPDVYSFRFISDKPAVPTLPGQHVVVSVQQEGEWIHRPYTLTSVDGPFLEITIKRDPHGAMSRAMFDIKKGTEVRLSEPRGDFHIDPLQSAPIVCLVGGIGVTPAIAMARYLARPGQRQLHIDYSTSIDEQVPFREELTGLAKKWPNLSVNFRTTSRQGFIDQKDISDLVSGFPGATFTVCGPGNYTESVERFLAKEGASDRTHVESFGPRVVEPEDKTIWRGLRVVTGILFALYVAQGLLDIPFPWLDSLQGTSPYRQWSGSAVAVFVSLQLLLPLARIERLSRLAKPLLNIHRMVGVLGPIILYFHAADFGYGYLALLSGVYIANGLVGAADKQIFDGRVAQARWVRWWLPLHIILSMGLIGVMLFHIFTVFAFQ